MKILFVSAVFPYPLYSGGQIRIYNLLKELSKDHEISLFSFIRSDTERQYIDKLSFCKRVETVYRGHAWQPGYVLHSVFGEYPFLLSTYDNASMRQLLTQTLQSDMYDLIHLEPGYVWPSLSAHSIPVVVSEHNIEHTIYEQYVRQFPIVPLRPLLFADVLKLKFWEKKIWKSASHVVTVSEDDKNYVSGVVDSSKISVVPNGVDLQQFPFAQKKEKGEAPTFLFVGNFLWMQNLDAVKFLISDIWPRIKEMYPKGTLRIVGKRLPEYLRRRMSNGIMLLEHVEEIADEYKKADVLLAPIRIGGGTKFKILEAMAMGVPVVTTKRGAEGLEVANRKEVYIADAAEDVVVAIKDILTDTPKRNAIIRAARIVIEEKYSWKNIARKLDSVWNEVAHAKNH